MMRRESPYWLFLRRNPGWLLALLLLLVQIVLIGLVFMLASSQRPATEARPAYQPAGSDNGPFDRSSSLPALSQPQRWLTLAAGATLTVSRRGRLVLGPATVA